MTLESPNMRMLTWELAFATFFTKNDLTEQKYDHAPAPKPRLLLRFSLKSGTKLAFREENAQVNVFIMAERSQDDELSRTVSADIPLFAVAFILMAA